jgi:hypothetical protein
MSIIKPNNNTISAITALPAGVGGKVLQVVSTAKTDSFSTTATSDTAVTGLSLSITPSSSSNKIFVIFTGVTYCLNSANYFGAMSIYRDSTEIVGGQAGVAGTSGGVVNSALSILDTPNTTSAITYQLYVKSEGNSSTVKINEPSGVVDTEKAVITAYEIQG